MKERPKVLFPPRAQRVKLLVQDSTCSIISLKWLYKKMLLYNVKEEIHNVTFLFINTLGCCFIL